MPWENHITSLKNCTVSSAVISLEGADCGHIGDWKASNSETIKIARLIKGCTETGPHFNYGNEDYKIVKVSDDYIVAHGGVGGLLFAKTKTLIIVAEYEFKKNSDAVETQLSTNVYPIIDKLKYIGY